MGQSPLPQAARLSQGQCLRLTLSSLPPPPSCLLGPWGPRWGQGCGGGPKGKQLLPSLPASGDHHTPSLEACAGGSLPSFAPSPGMGVGQGPAKLTRVGGAIVLAFFPLYPIPQGYIAGWSLRPMSVEPGVWFPFDFWILKVHSFWRLLPSVTQSPLPESWVGRVGQAMGEKVSGELHEGPLHPNFLRAPSLGRVGDHQAFSTRFLKI